MLRQSKGARRYITPVTLCKEAVGVSEYGDRTIGDAVPVMVVYAEVTRMSAQKTMLTFQQADVIGVEIEFRTPDADYNVIKYQGNDVHFAEPELIDRGRVTRVTGYYQKDNPNESVL